MPRRTTGPLLKYIPEAVWNDSTQFDNALTNNQPWGIGLSIYPANIIAGGGGPSNCSTNNTALNPGSCISGYSKPSWQRGAGVPADGVRDLPDISLMAGNDFHNATWLVCDDTTNLTSGLVNNCAVQSDGSFNYAAYRRYIHLGAGLRRHPGAGGAKHRRTTGPGGSATLQPLQRQSCRGKSSTM